VLTEVGSLLNLCSPVSCNMLWSCLEVELPLVRVLVESETAGFRFNILEGRKLLQKVENIRASLENAAQDLVQWKFNLNSPKQVAIVSSAIKSLFYVT
jgi:DNA polymerase I-like protein with 3'-5' exonuclease and polymerase domains